MVGYSLLRQKIGINMGIEPAPFWANLFSSALVGEFLKIARSFLLYKDFNKKVMELVNRMKAQGAQFLKCRKAFFKIIRKHEKAFANFGKSCDEILSELHI